MIILKKKTIVSVCTVILISIFAYLGIDGIIIANYDTIEVATSPINEKVIIVDARARCARSVGAVSESGVTEEEINLKIALKLEKLLKQAGATVILTRVDEYGISGLENATIRQKHRADLKNRVKIGNESGADIFVSIHLNKIPQTQYSGWQTFFKGGSEESQKLGEAIQERIK